MYQANKPKGVWNVPLTLEVASQSRISSRLDLWHANLILSLSCTRWLCRCSSAGRLLRDVVVAVSQSLLSRASFDLVPPLFNVKFRVFIYLFLERVLVHILPLQLRYLLYVLIIELIRLRGHRLREDIPGLCCEHVIGLGLQEVLQDWVGLIW